MIQLACNISGIDSDYFVAACIKSIERGNDLMKFLKPGQRGIRNQYFIDFCHREYKKRNFISQPSIEEIELNFGVEFCLFEKGAGKNKKLRLTKLPTFERPVVFILKEPRRKNQRLG